MTFVRKMLVGISFVALLMIAGISAFVVTSTDSHAWPADYGDQFLRMTDDDLVKAGLRGIAYCRLFEGYPGAPCRYYMRINSIPWPEGTGCTDSKYMYKYRCSEFDQVKNAACVLRLAISGRYCF